jgi:ribosomal protein S18 acetylase RimI-like enzyme
VTSGITIRDYRDGDAEAVIAIAKDLQAHELTIYDRLKPVDAIDADYLKVLWAEVNKRTGKFLVAEHEDTVAGYCTLLTNCDSCDDEIEVFYRYSFIGDIAVREAKRSLGIGKALLDECENIARAAGIKWLRLAVMADNLRARRFYARAGFGEHLIRLEKPL